MKYAVLLPLFALVAGCHSSAPGYTPTPAPVVAPVVPSTVSNVRALMPLDIGNQWVYTYRSEFFSGGRSQGQTDGEITYRVSGRRPDGSAILVLEQGGTVQDRQGMRSDSQTVYQVSEVTHDGGELRDVDYEPAQPIVLLPLTPGRHFKWSGRGVMSDGNVADGESDSEILPSQRVDTGMGPRSAFPILCNSTYNGKKSQNTTWFQPGTGMIRYRQETTSKEVQQVDNKKRTVDVKTVLSLTLKNYTLQSK